MFIQLKRPNGEDVIINSEYVVSATPKREDLEIKLSDGSLVLVTSSPSFLVSKLSGEKEPEPPKKFVPKVTKTDD